MNQSNMNNRGIATVAGEPVKRILVGMLTAAWMAGASAANVAPTVSMTAPLANAAFVAPTAITLSASPADSDGTIASVAFYNGTTLLGTVTTPPYNWVPRITGDFRRSVVFVPASDAVEHRPSRSRALFLSCHYRFLQSGRTAGVRTPRSWPPSSKPDAANCRQRLSS